MILYSIQVEVEVREKSIRKKWEVSTEVYIVFIFVYFHVILPYLVTTLLYYIHFSRFSS